MWAVFKLKKNEYTIFCQNLRKYLQENIEIYTPKIKVKAKKSNKYITKLIINNYVFIYNNKFSDKIFINGLQNLKGLEYILSGYECNQNEIEKFIIHCKKFEDKNGFLTQGFFDFNKFKRKGCFISGPFSRFIFDILDKQKKQLKISIANLKVTLSKNSDYLFCPCN